MSQSWKFEVLLGIPHILPPAWKRYVLSNLLQSIGRKCSFNLSWEHALLFCYASFLFVFLNPFSLTQKPKGGRKKQKSDKWLRLWVKAKLRLAPICTSHPRTSIFWNQWKLEIITPSRNLEPLMYFKTLWSQTIQSLQQRDNNQ